MNKVVGLTTAALIAVALCLISAGCASDRTGDARTIRVSAESVNAAEPATASLDDGRVVVAWVEHKENAADVMLQIFDRQGNAAATPVRVNANAGEAKAWRGDPPVVAVTSNGTIYVSWTAAIPDTKGTTLYVSTSRDGGRSFEPAVKVNDDAGAASHGMHSLAADNSDHVYVAWLDERNVVASRMPEMHHASTMDAPEPNAELYFAESQDGGRSFSQNRKIASEACPCCKTSIATGNDGRSYVGFREVLPGEFRHIAIVPSIDGGQTFGQPTVVANDSWQINACPVSGPSLELKDGALEVVWFAGGDARPKGVYWTHSHDLNNLAFSEPQLVAETVSAGTPTLSNNRVVWSELRKLRTAHLAEHKTENIRDLIDGSVPAVAQNDSAAFVVFARDENDRSSVMLTILPR
jgi:hypothetical protein